VVRLALRNVRTHAVRTALTVLAVLLGGAMLSGSLIYGESAKAAFFDDLAREAAGVDVSALAPPSSNEATLDTVAAVPGVAHVDRRITTRLGLLDRRGRVIANGSGLGFAISLPTWPGFSMARTLAGKPPERPGQAALDAHTAARQGIEVGDTVRVMDPDWVPRELLVVGLVDLGVSPVFADSSVLVLTAPDLAALTVGQPSDVEIVVAAQPGTSENVLRDRIAAALGDGYAVRTGTQVRHDLAVRSAKYVDGFLAVLTATALVALAVGGLVVYNTFRILVAQRTREYALLRCVGASRGQLVRLVFVESGLIGLAAAVGGVGLGTGVGWALLAGQDTLGRGLPDYHVSVPLLAMVAPVVTGFVVTVGSALIPAFAAGRVSPLAALRSVASSGARWWPILAAALAVGLGVAGVVLLNTGRGHGFEGLTRIVGGAMVAFTGLVLLLPLVIMALTAPLRWLLGHGLGVVGRLAVDNASRHPVRLAATAAALMIGIAPLTTFAIILATVQVQAERELNENFAVDFVVSHVDDRTGRSPIEAQTMDRLRATPELDAVTLTRATNAYADGCCTLVGAVEPGTGISPELLAGALQGLPAGTVAVHNSFALDHHLALGDTISLGSGGNLWTARVVAVFDDSPIPGDVLTSWADFTTNLTGDDYVLLSRAPGVDAGRAAAAIDAVLADDPAAVVTSSAARHDALSYSINRRLLQFDILLGISLVIALLGISNALALAVLERRRESATQRALGLTRAQLYQVLGIEAVLVCVMGALLGAAFGTGVGWVTARELILMYGHGTPVIPFATIGGYLALAALAGVLASIVPGRMTARREIASTLHES
jgi:putative ABC transport system permease protein